jgi:hypothetical protein
MEQLTYSSTAAFLAHYRILNSAGMKRGNTRSLAAPECEILEAMNQVMEALTPEERAVLLADVTGAAEHGSSSEEGRRRERAQLKLRRLLLTRGILRG